MHLKNTECIKVIKSNKDTDLLILGSNQDHKEYVSLAGMSYFKEDREGLKHIAYCPGFGSGFDDIEKTQAIIHDLSATEFDTAFLLFLNKETALNFEKSYNSFEKTAYTKLSPRELINLNLVHKTKNDLLDNIARGMKQKIKSQGTPYKILTEYHPDFFQLYTTLSKEKSFSKAYQYTEKSLELLSKCHDIFFIGIAVDDKLFAASFFRLVKTTTGQRVDYLLSASLPEASSKWTAKVIWYGIQKAIEKGCANFNFGGGVKDGDSLHNFKLGFGGNSVPFYRCRVINKYGDRKDELLAKKILNNTFFP